MDGPPPSTTTSSPPMDTSSGTPDASKDFSVTDSVLAYGGLYVMAIACIYVGSKRSVQFVRKHVEEGRLIENSISDKDARMFPFTASGVLFSLYLFFKYGDQLTKENLFKLIKTAKAYIQNKSVEVADTVSEASNNETVLEVANATANATGLRLALSYLPAVNKHNVMLLLMVLICFEGCMALASLIKPFVQRLIAKLPSGKWTDNCQYELSFKKGAMGMPASMEPLFECDFDWHDVVAFALVAPIGVAHVLCGHWITNDVIGVAFSVYAIESLHLCTFKGGCMLLAGLFVYDVFWVFATDVMTTVATGVKAPILLQFPQDLLANGLAGASKHAMLGLGDIVIPGVFLAMLLRFDETSKTRCYFASTMVAYAAGLVLTIAVMHWFKAAQPALLYLVPACVGVPSLLALAKGQFASLWAFSEEHLVKKDDEKEQEGGGEDKKDK